MRALVWHGPERMSVDELPDPVPAAGEVLLAPAAAGICGSDLEGYLGTQANRTPPLVMGHELAGRVVAVGPGVDPGWEHRDVAVNPLVAGDDALAGIEQLSTRRELIGVHRPGGFASLVRVPVGRLRCMPPGADPRLGVLAEPFANGVHAARIGRAGVEGGPVDRVVVLGAGTIGLMALQAAELGGAARTTVLEPNADRRAAAAALGADAVVADADALEEADLVLDAVGPGGDAAARGAAPAPGRLRRADRARGRRDGDRLPRRGPPRADAARRLRLHGRRLRRGAAAAARRPAGLGELEPVLPLDAGPDAFAELAAGPSARLRVFLGDR